MNAARVLFVEDDASLREAVSAAMRREGYAVHAEPDGRALEYWTVAFRPDLALFDVRLPDGDDGFTLAARLRAIADIPIVFLTALDTVADRLRGFELGADDYVVKPFSIAEFLARVRAVLRRSGRLRSPTHEVCDLVVDEANRVVIRGGVEIPLTRTEFELLAVLARHAGDVLSKTQLLSLIWGFDGYDANLVEVHISAVRKKLEAHGPRLLHTERGEGYVLRAPVLG